jgi:hypothetical protein
MLKPAAQHRKARSAFSAHFARFRINLRRSRFDSTQSQHSSLSGFDCFTSGKPGERARKETELRFPSAASPRTGWPSQRPTITDGSRSNDQQKMTDVQSPLPHPAVSTRHWLAFLLLAFHAIDVFSTARFGRTMLR